MTVASMRCYESRRMNGVMARALAWCPLRVLARWCLATALGFVIAGPAAAHKSSDSYLQVDARTDGLAVRWDIALRDLDAAVDLDADLDGKLTWAEVKRGWPAIEGYALPRMGLDGCVLTVTRHTLEKRSDGAYAVLWLDSPCVAAPASALQIRYMLFAEIDPTHRGIARVQTPGQPLQLRVLDPTARADSSASASPITGAARASSSTSAPQAASPDPVIGSFLLEGVEHILGGYDHVLFLLCLLLPAVVKRDAAGRVVPVDSLWQAVVPVAGIVTAFTVAHSITLGLAALRVVSLPSSFIEPAIAVTIMIAAVDNVKRLFGGHRAAVTFFFGLIHGFGFAGVLGELGLPAADFAWALFQFNVGLELGQLSIVLAAVTLLYLARRWQGYRRWVIGGGSLLAGVIALVWFIERMSGSKWLPV